MSGARNAAQENAFLLPKRALGKVISQVVGNCCQVLSENLSSLTCSEFEPTPFSSGLNQIK